MFKKLPEMRIPQLRPDRLVDGFGFKDGLLAVGIYPDRAKFTFLLLPDLFPLPPLPANASGQNLPRQIQRFAIAVPVDVPATADHRQHVEYRRPFRY